MMSVAISSDLKPSLAKNQFTSLISQSSDTLLKNTMALGATGKAINSGVFGVGSRKKDIIQKWGKPQYQDFWYLSYRNRHIAFSLDSAGKVITVQTTDPDLLSTNYNDLEKVLGKPSEHDQGAGNIYDSYHAGKYIVEFHSTDMKEPGKVVFTSVNVYKKR